MECLQLPGTEIYHFTYMEAYTGWLFLNAFFVSDGTFKKEDSSLTFELLASSKCKRIGVFW